MTMEEFTKIVGENTRLSYSQTISYAEENYGKELYLLEEMGGDWKITDMKKPSELDYETGLMYFVSMVKLSEAKHLSSEQFKRLLETMAKETMNYESGVICIKQPSRLQMLICRIKSLFGRM